jgi:hypothetical protein
VVGVNIGGLVENIAKREAGPPAALNILVGIFLSVRDGAFQEVFYEPTLAHLRSKWGDFFPQAPLEPQIFE